MESIDEQYIKLAKNKTQVDLIKHLLENNGSMFVKHKIKIDKAMDLCKLYPDDFSFEYRSMYPLIIDFKLVNISFNN